MKKYRKHYVVPTQGQLFVRIQTEEDSFNDVDPVDIRQDSLSAAMNAAREAMTAMTGDGMVSVIRKFRDGSGEFVCVSYRTYGGPWQTSEGKPPCHLQMAAASRPVARRFPMRGYSGYGQVPILPATPQEAAQQICAAMGGQWRADALECQVGGQSYSLPDFLPGAMPSGTCPPEQVMTPAGCKPIPGGVEPEEPPEPPDPAATCHAQGGAYDPTTGMCKLPVAKAEPAMPEWVLPVAIGGIGAIAIVGLIMTTRS